MQGSRSRLGTGPGLDYTEANQEPLQEVSILDSPNKKPRLFRYCCDELVDALKWGLLEIDGNYGEINLGYHTLDPQWDVGNILTGEKYDNSKMSMSQAVAFCPFCGTDIGSHEPDEE